MTLNAKIRVFMDF